MPDIYEGCIAGWNGYAVAVRKIGGGRVKIHYDYDQPERTCQTCIGTGSALVMRRETVGMVVCPECAGTGKLRARKRYMTRWVDVSELTAAPPKPAVDRELAALAMDLLRGKVVD